MIPNRTSRPNTRKRNLRTMMRGGVETTTTLTDFSEEVLITIIGYAYGTLFNGASSPVAKLYKTFGLVSKDTAYICTRYVQCVPLIIPYSVHEHMQLLNWMVRTRVKLGEITLGFDMYEEARVSIQILVHCDTTTLKTVNVDCAYGGSVIVDILSEHVPALTAMKLRIYKDHWYEPLLTTFCNRLEQLELKVMSTSSEPGPCCFDEDLQRVSNVISRMSSLKKLSISFYFKGSFKIRSESLEEIDTYDARICGYVKMEECVCPSLKMFTFEQWQDGGMSLTALTPIQQTELVPRGEGDGVALAFAEFKAEARPFIGLKVPDSCTIRIFSGENSENYDVDDYSDAESYFDLEEEEDSDEEDGKGSSSMDMS